MPDNKDKLKELHGNLIKDNYDLPKYEVFEKDMSDIKKLSELRDNLIKDNYDLPDINTFKRDMGFGVDFKAPKYEPGPPEYDNTLPSFRKKPSNLPGILPDINVYNLTSLLLFVDKVRSF